MDSFSILAVITSTVIFIIIPLLFIGLIFFILKKKTSKKIAITISIILLAGFSYLLITSLYPTEAFYRNNFEENTEMKLPSSKKPTYHLGNHSIYNFGDYSISYSYEFTTQDYDDLYIQLTSKGFQQAENYLETDGNEKILSLDSSTKIEKILTKEFGFKDFDVLFMDDNRTIIFNSNTW